jgi:YggT family protein
MQSMSAIITIVSLAFQIYEFLILIRVLLSWVRINPYHPVIRILYQITDPVLDPLRRVIPPIGGAIDISPVVALIILEIVHRIVISVLVGL